jgi:hypothetical protein
MFSLHPHSHLLLDRRLWHETENLRLVVERVCPHWWGVQYSFNLNLRLPVSTPSALSRERKTM